MRARRLFAALALALLAVAAPVALAPPGSATPTGDQVVISEVFGGGGNSGATLANDYIELHNPTSQPVCLDGWSVQYGSATNSSSAISASTPLSGVIAPGGYYLIQEAAGTNAGAALPTPNATGSITMGGGAGRVQLATDAGAVVDRVGYGAGASTIYETAPTPSLSSTTAAIREGGGAVDTDDNSADFTVATPDPDNGPSTPCSDDPPPPDDECGAAVTHQVAQVQGSGETSPLVGTSVRVEGVVTGDFQASGMVGGFYLQDDTPDADPATSDGVLVFTATPVSPGDRVRLTGTVVEFRRGSDALPGTVTELGSVSNLVVCGIGTITPTPLELPFDALGDRESLEGVLVEVPAGLTATELFEWARFGTVAMSSGGRLYNPTNGNEPTTAEANDRRLVHLDDARSTQNPATPAYVRDDRTPPRLGDTLSESITGVFTYEFDRYRVQPIEPVAGVSLLTAAGPRPAAPEAVGGDVQVSTFNTLNYFVTVDTSTNQGDPTTTDDEPRGADTAAELERQRAKLLPAILGLDADVLGLIEIENSSAGALQDLVDRLNSLQPDPADDYVAVPEPDLGMAPNVYGGAFGTDLIKVAILYRPAVVTPVGDAVSSADPVFNRPPLAQTFVLAGGSEPFTPVMNHFKSKGSCPAPGTDPTNDELGQGCWNALRVEQAETVLDLIATEGLLGPVLLGDLNSYAEEDPVHLVEEAGYGSVAEAHVPAPDRYSFVFDGEAGELDHALVSTSLLGRVTGADIWHINADEASGTDYNDFNVNQAIDGQPLYQPGPFRSSDHDPLLFGLDLLEAPGSPTAVAAEPGWAAATVSWEAPDSSAGGDPTGYVLRAYDGELLVDEAEVGADTFSAAMGPLEVGVEHRIEVVAVNDDGTSAAAETTVVPTDRPAGFRNLRTTGTCAAGMVTFTITNPNDQAAGVTWSAPKVGVAGAVAVPANGTATVVVPAAGRGIQVLEVRIAGIDQPAGSARC